MAGALPHPVLVFAERQRAGDEGAAEAVEAEAAFQRPGAREVGALELGVEQVRTHAVGEVVQLERAAVLLHEDEIVGVVTLLVIGSRATMVAPRLQRVGDAGRELPPARMVGLVLVERDGLVLEVEILPLQVRRLCAAHAFTVKETVEETEAERDARAREQRDVLARVQDREAFLRRGLRQPATGQGIAVDVAGELGEVQDPVHQSRVLPAR